MWISAVALSICVWPVSILFFVQPENPFRYLDLTTFIDLGLIALAFLLPLCDAALIFDAVNKVKQKTGDVQAGATPYSKT
jgi:hypothetical protein